MLAPLKQLTRWLSLPLISLTLTGCISLSPEVYLVDRHTVMESEAAGEWPAMERRFIEAGRHAGPVPLAEDPLMSTRRERAFRVLNGEFVTTPSRDGDQP